MDEVKSHLESNAIDKAESSLSVLRLLVPTVTGAVGCPILVHPTFRQGAVIVSPQEGLTNKQSKSEFSFLTPPCDFVEDLSDFFQESKSFELELEIPVVSDPVVQQMSVKGKLFKSIQHWQSLGSPDFVS